MPNIKLQHVNVTVIRMVMKDGRGQGDRSQRLKPFISSRIDLCSGITNQIMAERMLNQRTP